MSGEKKAKGKRGDLEEILKWFNEMPKDEEFAKLLDEIVEKNEKRNENKPNLSMRTLREKVKKNA
jgi:hypothetical protein